MTVGLVGWEGMHLVGWEGMQQSLGTLSHVGKECDSSKILGNTSSFSSISKRKEKKRRYFDDKWKVTHH